MSNFDEYDPRSIAKFVWDNLPRHKHMAVATSDQSGRPWVVCVNLAYDADLTIVWKSDLATVRSRHIAERPEVAICIFSETAGIGDFGLYCEAMAHTVEDPAELERLLAVRYHHINKPLPPVSDFVGEAPARLYAATITHAWVNDDRHQKTPIDMASIKGANV